MQGLFIHCYSLFEGSSAEIVYLVEWSQYNEITRIAAPTELAGGQAACCLSVGFL
jgi:hypothetical protein